MLSENKRATIIQAMLLSIAVVGMFGKETFAQIKIPPQPAGQIIWERIFSNQEGKIAIQAIEDMLKSGRSIDTLEVVKRATVRKSALPEIIDTLKVFEKVQYNGREWQADNGAKSNKWQKVITNEYKTSGGFVALYHQVSYETWRDDAYGRGLPDSCRGVLSYYQSDGTKLWETAFPKNIYSHGSLKLSNDGDYIFINVSHVDSIFERGRNWVFNKAGQKVLDTKHDFAAPVISPNGRYYLSVERIGTDPLYNDYKVVCFDIEGGKRSEMTFKNLHCMQLIEVYIITNDGLFPINRTDINEIQIYNNECKLINKLPLPKVSRSDVFLYYGGKYITAFYDKQCRVFDGVSKKEIINIDKMKRSLLFPDGNIISDHAGTQVLKDGSIFIYGFNKPVPFHPEERKTICVVADSTGVKKWFMASGALNAYYNESSNMILLDDAMKGVLEMAFLNSTKKERERKMREKKQTKVIIVNFQ